MSGRCSVERNIGESYMAAPRSIHLFHGDGITFLLYEMRFLTMYIRSKSIFRIIFIIYGVPKHLCQYTSNLNRSRSNSSCIKTFSDGLNSSLRSHVFIYAFSGRHSVIDLNKLTTIQQQHLTPPTVTGFASPPVRFDWRRRTEKDIRRRKEAQESG